MNKFWGFTYITIIVLVLFTIPNAFAATIHVPQDQKTIQAGIIAAVDGDTVLVADGTYKGEGNVNINFKGKQIIVKSRNGAASTIIDCGLKLETRGFIFNRRENQKSVLDGFTIKNGWQTEGGGIFCENASPTIRNCVITENRAVDILNSTGTGGGIYAINSNVYLSSCVITKNRTGSNIGGGVYLKGVSESRVNPYHSIIYNCTISENIGGGVYSINHVNIWLKDSTVSRNRNGSGVVVRENMGVGSNLISKCLIEFNNGRNGAGILCAEDTMLTITDSVIRKNFGVVGGGIYCERTATMDLSDCLIVGNHAQQGAGILVDSGTGKATIKHCTITENTAFLRGGGIFVFVLPNFNTVFTLTDSIVWGNRTFGTHPEIKAHGFHFVIRSCNIGGGLEGLNIPFIPNNNVFQYEDNIDADPLFVDPENDDYSLKPNSPAKSMGFQSSLDGVFSVNAIGKTLVQWGELKRIE